MQIFFVYTYEENLRYGGIIMTDFMQIICDYLLENRCKEFLPQEYYWHYTRLAEKQESALLETLSDSQWELLEQYQTTRNTMHSHELEAMFLAAWQTSRELA